MTPRTWSLALGTTATIAANSCIRRYTHVWASSNRVYLPVRKELEFEPLLSLPNPLLAHFSFPTDSKCQAVTKALKTIVDGETPFALSTVDVECDEPDAQHLILRYGVTEFPTVLCLKGGDYISSFCPKGNDPETNLRHWIKELQNNIA